MLKKSALMPATAPVRLAIDDSVSLAGSAMASCDSTTPRRTLGPDRHTFRTWAFWAPPTVSTLSVVWVMPRVIVWGALVFSSTTRGHWSGVVGNQPVPLPPLV